MTQKGTFSPEDESFTPTDEVKEDSKGPDTETKPTTRRASTSSPK